jgi:hypothetical protein
VTPDGFTFARRILIKRRQDGQCDFMRLSARLYGRALGLFFSLIVMIRSSPGYGTAGMPLSLIRDLAADFALNPRWGF